MSILRRKKMIIQEEEFNKKLNYKGISKIELTLHTSGKLIHVIVYSLSPSPMFAVTGGLMEFRAMLHI